jgi:hypothetical protein
VEEIYDLEQKNLDALDPVYGLILLFKWVKEKDDGKRPGIEDVPDVFFCKASNNERLCNSSYHFNINEPS